MTQNEHAYAICCRTEVANDVISGRNVKTTEGYIVVNFEIASSSSFRDFSKRLFCDDEVGDGSEDAKTFQEFAIICMLLASVVCEFAMESKSAIYGIRRSI